MEPVEATSSRPGRPRPCHTSVRTRLRVLAAAATAGAPGRAAVAPRPAAPEPTRGGWTLEDAGRLVAELLQGSPPLSRDQVAAALRDPHLQCLLRDAAARYYRSVCGTLADLAAVGGPLDGAHRHCQDSLQPYLDFSRRVDGGYYRSRPDQFLRDYARLRERLHRLRAEADHLAERSGRPRTGRREALPPLTPQ